jgi:hypothetical protein
VCTTSRFLPEGLVGALCVALCALAVLGALAQVYETDNLYVEGQGFGFNDQAGYITTARWLADTGELRSHLIYPAYVTEPNWRLYMPGQYYALASAYTLFGDHPLAWRAPALLSFILSAVGVFLIGRRFFGNAEGLVAAGIFMALPANGLFAFVAMPQSPFIASAVLSFCVFAYLPHRTRAFWVPFLLIPPFLMRETGALLVIPMAVLCLRGGRFGALASGAIAAGGSVLMLSALLAIQTASGKGALPLSWVLSGSFNYANAFPRVLDPSAWEWVSGLAQNALRNFGVISANAELRWQAVEPILILMALAVIGLFNPKRRLALATVGLVISVTGLMTFLYDWNDYRGTRSLLFTFPLCAIAAAPVLVRWITAAGKKLASGPAGRLGTILPWGLAIGLTVAWSVRVAQGFAEAVNSEYGAGAVELLETIDVQQDKLLVSPFNISLDYVVAHYPIRWSFVPENPRTLLLLDSIHEIGTFIIRNDQLSYAKVQILDKLGFRFQQKFGFKSTAGTATYWIFQRPDTTP